MSSQSFDFQDLLQLVELMKSTSQFNEFKLRANGIELELRRGPGGDAAGGLDGATALAAAPSMAATTSMSSAAAPAAAPASAHPQAPAPSAAVAPSSSAIPRQEPHPRGSPPPAARVAAEGQIVVKAPMVGTVYLAPEPGADPFVAIGQRVEARTQVCIVEVMKLMNAIPAGGAGTVTEVLVGDAEPVEYGQPLFVITP